MLKQVLNSNAKSQLNINPKSCFFISNIIQKFLQSFPKNELSHVISFSIDDICIL